MTLLTSLRSESVKIRKSSAWYLCLIAVVVLPLMQLIDLNNDADVVQSLQKDPWNLYYLGSYQQFTLFLPPVMILLGTMLPQIEYRNHAWRQVLTAPQPLSLIYLSKFLSMHGLVLLVLIGYHLLMLITAVLLHLLHPGILLFDHAFPLGEWASGAFRSYIALLGFSAVQFWLGLRFRNFIVPLLLGFGLWFSGGSMVFELQSPYVPWYPFSYPILNLLPDFQKIAVQVRLSSVGYMLLFLALGFADFRRGKLNFS